jgi:hypothetical protein
VDTTCHDIGEQWEFRCEETGRGWRWRRRAANGSIVAVASAALPTLHAAVADASRNGFSYIEQLRSV